MAPPCHREIVYLASFKEQLGSEQIFGKKKKNLRCGMYVCMYEIKVYRSRLYKMPNGVHAVLPMMRNSLLCCWTC